MKVHELMATDVVTLRPETTLYDAIKKLLAHEISGAPVVSSLGEIITLVTEADLMKLAALGDINLPLNRFLDKLPTLRQLLIVRPDDSFHDLFKPFLLNPVRRVLVVDAIGKLRRVVAHKDIIRAFVQAEDADRAAPFS